MIELLIGLLLGGLLVGLPALVLISMERAQQPEEIENDDTFSLPIHSLNESQRKAENEVARVASEQISDSYLRVEPGEVSIEEVSITADGWVVRFQKK